MTKQIAFEFGTKVDTVKEQRAQVMLKMQATSVADLVRIAGRLGLSSSPGNWWPGVGDLVKTVSTLVAELSAHPTC